MNKNTNQKKRPTHTIFQVVGDGDKARWIRVGAGWTNKDGKGLFLRFDAYPVVGHITVRENTEPDNREDNGRQQ